MKRPTRLELLTTALVAAIAIVGCKKKEQEQAESKTPGGTPNAATVDPTGVSPGKEPAEKPTANPDDTPPEEPGETVPGKVATDPPETPTTTPPEDLAGKSTKDPSGDGTDEGEDTPPFEPGEVSDVDADGNPTTETLLAALPVTPHSTTLRSGLDLGDQIALVLEGAEDVPAALAALEVLDGKFQEVAEQMKSLGDPDGESSERFNEVLRSKTELDGRVKAAMRNLIKLDPTKPPEEAGRQANLDSAQMYRAVSQLFGHFQKAWPTVHP